ncbi:hypothetical protein V495_07000 [Pseudogymnoascus sp. VKM F-4514 (FW-929)]|nr:hypothetical protein V495_07000 [Pseudogymnoascus sp. VKM F-4514 (FW-929)]KFY54200.1 hypothetical protein V497_07889 [Pseudogymnoascus sp. VKM F-4516 (FW-969)]
MLFSLLQNAYPRATKNRISATHPSLKATRAKFFQAAALNFVLLQLLFFGLLCYLFGSLFQQTSRTHALNVLWVDYDGGVVGDAVRDAYKSLESDGFPTIVERPKDEFPSERELREAVCDTTYWATLYTALGSSERLELALSGAASQYNQSDVLFYIWNEARYPTVLDGAISSSLQILSNTARVAYAGRNSAFALATIQPNDTTAMSTFANPWTLSSINIQPTTQGSRAVYNTICIVLILIQDFFYLASINGLYAQFKVYNKISPTRIILTRDFISGTFTMVGSLLVSAAIWAFKDGWMLSGKQFAINWLIIWLFAHVNFLAIDVFTIWLPPQYIPMALITWIITNVTSILLPFSLSHSFYRWAYALPAHEAYEALTDNWSSGCNPHLYYALPILFAYEIIGLAATAVGVYRRCHFAVVAEEAGEEAIRLRLEVALKVERERSGTLKPSYDENNTNDLPQDTNDGASVSKARLTSLHTDVPKETRTMAEVKNRADMEADIEGLGKEIVRIETRASRGGNLGPSFRLVGS